jgi:hypothetical protein
MRIAGLGLGERRLWVGRRVRRGRGPHLGLGRLSGFENRWRRGGPSGWGRLFGRMGTALNGVSLHGRALWWRCGRRGLGLMDRSDARLGPNLMAGVAQWAHFGAT